MLFGEFMEPPNSGMTRHYKWCDPHRERLSASGGRSLVACKASPDHQRALLKARRTVGKGNFKALFEAIEREQESRGTL